MGTCDMRKLLMSGHHCSRALGTSWILLSESVCSFQQSLSSLIGPLTFQGNYHIAQHSIFIIHLVTFTKCFFSNIRISVPLRAAGSTSCRCSGVHDVGTRSLAPKRPSPDISVLPGDCVALCWMEPIVLILLCRYRCIHNNDCLAPACKKRKFIIHSYSISSLRVHFSMHINVNKAMQLDHTQVLRRHAGPDWS